MKKIKKNIWMILVAIIAFSGISILNSSCSSSGSGFLGEPVGITPYNKKRSNVVRSNIKVRDPHVKNDKKKRY